jgi:hypothetical protein
MEQQQANFEGWAIVEMMGHQREIGYVTTEYFGGAALFRVDAPEIPERDAELNRPEYLIVEDSCRLCPRGTKVRRLAIPAKTRFVAPGALYALTPCTEETARKAIEEMVPRSPIVLHIPEDSQKRLLTGEPDPYFDGELNDDGETKESACPECGVFVGEEHEIGCSQP